MSGVSRRLFNKRLATVAGGLAASSLPTSQSFAQKKSKKAARGAGRVVIIGGGVGGISVAKFIHEKAPKINITLIEPRETYTSCFFSNQYVGGFRSLKSLNHSYSAVQSIGIHWIKDYAVNIDHDKQEVILNDGKKVFYDRLILSPGVAIDYDQIEGYSREAAQVMPHAWQFGEQTQVLRNNLLDMEDGGVVSLVIGEGADRGRSPYAVYERASLIAHYLKSYKPASKLMIFDAKSDFALKSLYMESWKKHYAGILEWIDPKTTNGGIQRVDHNKKVLFDGNGQEIKSAVTSIIPKQKAGLIAQSLGITDGDWCPIEASSFKSIKDNKIYVLGDAAQNGTMPRTASAAYSQARVVGNSIIADLADKKRFPARFTTTCWAVLSTNDAIKFGGSFKAGKTKVEKTDSFASKVGEGDVVRAKTYREAQDWYKTISSDIFSKGKV